MNRATASARVKLAALFLAAGYDESKILNLIRYPVVCSFALQGVDDGAGFFGPSNDDDHRIAISESPKDRKGLKILADKKRQAGRHRSFSEAFTETKKEHSAESLFKIGRYLVLDTFDGWRQKWKSNAYKISFSYHGVEEVESREGGRSRPVTDADDEAPPRPDPIGDYYSTGPHYFHYYDNGYVCIPPPSPWPYLPWRKPAVETSEGTGSRIN